MKSVEELEREITGLRDRLSKTERGPSLRINEGLDLGTVRDVQIPPDGQVND